MRATFGTDLCRLRNVLATSVLRYVAFRTLKGRISRRERASFAVQWATFWRTSASGNRVGRPKNMVKRWNFDGGLRYVA